MDTWILRMVRAAYVRRIVAWAVAIGCVVALVIGERRYITNFILGPFNFGPHNLDSISDLPDEPHYFVSVSGSKAIDTGIHHITIRKGGGEETRRSVSGLYYALLVGEKFLVVKSEGGMPTAVEGELTALPSYLDRELFNTPDMQANRGRFYPFYISDESFRIPGYFGIAGALAFGFLLLKYGLPAWKHLQNPSSHPVLRRVASWGDPIQLAVEIEREASSPRHKKGGWVVTDNYLVHTSFFTFDVLRLWDLLWAYKRVTRHSVNFIPTGKTYDAVLVCYGGTAEVAGTEKLVDGILAFAGDRAPWAVLGFSKELKNLFKKKTQDFCAAVDQRRRDWAQKART